MPQPSEGEGTIMFTRLDSERNTRTLKYEGGVRGGVRGERREEKGGHSSMKEG